MINLSEGFGNRKKLTFAVVISCLRYDAQKIWPAAQYGFEMYQYVGWYAPKPTFVFIRAMQVLALLLSYHRAPHTTTLTYDSKWTTI